jgi:signal peptidase II
MKILSGNFKSFGWLFLAGLIIFIDQLTKILAMHFLTFRQALAVFPSFNLFLNFNTGAAFSFLANAAGWQHWLFIIISLVVSLGIIIWLYIMPNGNEKILKFALMLVLGGALGNLIDRLMFGYVRDFLDFYFRSYHWATFNLADSAICIGVFFIFISSIRQSHRPQ